MPSPPSYAPNVVNQTVEHDGATWKGDPGTGWHLASTDPRHGGGGGAFGFNFEEETKKAYEKLKPYYSKILEYTKGDVELAKRIIKFEYDQGTRESKSEFELRQREQAITFPQERGEMVAGLGRRGIVGGATEKELWGGTAGGLAGQTAGRLVESQKVRQEAIERALEERESRLEAGKEFKTEDVERGLKKETQQLSRAHEREAGEMAGLKFGREATLKQMEQQQSMAERQMALAQEQWDWQKDYYNKYGNLFT